MNHYEFISYKPTPTDQYMLGIATIRVYGKIILRFKHAKTKDGTGEFFVPATYSITDEDNKKVYISAFMIDSRSEEEELQLLIRKGVRNALAAQSRPIQQSASVYATGVPVPPEFDAIPTPTQQELPF